ncbi:tol-pal system protein YbgF [Stappia sp. ICDLI1TA098]
MTQVRSIMNAQALGRVLVVLAALGLLPAPASAQLFGSSSRDDGETVVRINQVEEQMRTLTGQVEELSFQIRQLQDQIRRMQEDTEYRLQQLEQGGGGKKRSDAGGGASSQSLAGRDSYGPANAGTLGQLRTDSAGQPVEGQGSGDAEFAEAGTYQQEQGGLGAGPLDLSALARGQSSAPSGGAGYDPAVPGSGAAAPLSSGGSGTEGASGSHERKQVSALEGGQPRDDYDGAYSMMMAGDYGGAEQGFRRFLSSHPNDPLAANAQFWLGESYFARKQYRDAADAFLKSYTDYPDSSKVTDSLLKLGLSLKGIGQKDAACATFSELLTKYPGAPTSVRAEAQSQKQAGGCPA